MIYRNYIGGKWHDEGELADIKNPWDDVTVAQYHVATPDLVNKAIEVAHGANDKMRHLSPYLRQQILKQLSERLRERREEFSTTICMESAKPIQAAQLEVGRAITVLSIAAEEVGRSNGEVIQLSTTGFGNGQYGITRRFPVGPVSAISPYNFPLNLGMHKVAPAIAAGCPIIWKPSLLAPGTAFLFAELVAETDLPTGAMNVITPTDTDAEPLITDPRMRLLSFTGSAAVGWTLMGKARGKRTVLELGGNAAVIIGPDANIDDAVLQCKVGGYIYSGQVCISVQRILVHKSNLKEFTSKFVSAVSELKIGDPMEKDTYIGPMISDREAIRVKEWIMEAKSMGAKILIGGGQVDRMVEPTILTKVPHTANIWKEEAFGPVTIIEEFEGWDHAFAMVNDSRYGLQAGIFTNDIAVIKRAFEELQVGALIVNGSPSFRADNMPYGGIKDSGIGREGVRYAIEEMTELRFLVT
ncbi:MAG: aldehyde dehydrogenase family protein [Chthonomonadales bacterium]